MEKYRFKEILIKSCKELDLNLSEIQVDRFWVYMNFLLQENKKYNLTGIDNPEKIITKHFLDSLIVLYKFNFTKDDNIIDVGTGAGFPGLVLKIMKPELPFVLIDSRLKRINFIKLLLQKIGMDSGIEVFQGRAEEIAKQSEFRENFTKAVSRAVAPINILVEYMIPFLSIGGHAMLYKGPEYSGEVKEADKAISLLGGEIIGIEKVNVPGIDAERTIVNIEKIKLTPDSFPRRPGIPKKRPL